MNLPRLVYISDVPVESSYHGSSLLYRLLQDYPAQKLLIIERWPALSQPERRLKGIEYRIMSSGLTRPLPTRFSDVYTPVYLNLTGLDALILWQNIKAFKPEAVLSVHHGNVWAAAAKMAKQQGLPFHLILHDIGGTGMDRCSAYYSKKAYQQAVGRYCVSPYMIEDYERRYGSRGTLLYPGRARNAGIYTEPPERLGKPIPRPTVAYGGNIFKKGYAELLRKVSLILEPFGGRLLLFGPHNLENIKRMGLDRPNVELRGLLPSTDMIQIFRNEVDCIFVPMSFEEADRPNMEISFPSKLTDSTIPGVPLLICGPAYCSAVRWARENPGVAEVVDQCESGLLQKALEKIIGDGALRVHLGQAALDIGRKYFDFEVARDTLYRGLLS